MRKWYEIAGGSGMSLFSVFHYEADFLVTAEIAFAQCASHVAAQTSRGSLV